jgi:hypothetical protein
MDEYIPLARFKRLIQFWWLLVLSALLGGAVGSMAFLAKPPLYEATATFFASIDSTQTTHLTDPTRYQYDEDIALAVVERALLDPGVTEVTRQRAQEFNLSLPREELIHNMTIERRHAFWEARYRNLDPAAAQLGANLWAEAAYEQLLAWRETGQLVNYVVLAPPIPAELPQTPFLFNRNRLIFAGSLIGLVIGLILLEIAPVSASRPGVAPHPKKQ